MTNSLKIKMVQANPSVGDIDGNVDLAISHLSDDVDLIVYSECFITGYPINDLALRPAFVHKAEEAVLRLRDAVVAKAGPAILIGGLKSGSVLPYNTAYLIEPSGSVRSVFKTELPNSDVFDEVRLFSAYTQVPKPLAFRGHNLGVMICEDMWHAKVAESLYGEGADILIVINGSPYERDKQPIRVNHARRRIRGKNIPLIYVNQIGGQDELVFDGGSFVIDQKGQVIVQKPFSETTVNVVFSKDGGIEAEKPSYAHETYPIAIEADYRACVLGLKDYLRKTGSSRVVIGISGGLDSALVATMAVDAIGSKNVVGVMMPTRYTGGESLELADDLMNRLGIVREILPIESVFNTVKDEVGSVIARLAEKMGITPNMSITEENQQARIRGLSLMSISNALGTMVLSTGNKSEMAVGYATLYGDMCGGFNPLKSLYKSYAFKVCHWRNSVDGRVLFGSEVGMNPIPERIITRPPTAELKDDQTDEKALGPYNILDFVLHNLIEEKLDSATIAVALAKMDDFKNSIEMSPLAYAEKIARLVTIAQYKRNQACPGVKLGRTDFGAGWRYPISNKYRF